MAAASTDADHLAFSWMQSRIQPDFADLIEAHQFAKPALIEGRNVAMEYYFDRMAYEHFLITPTVTSFESKIEDLAADVRRSFPGEPVILGTRKRQWVERASGRASLETATFECIHESFRGDWLSEFRKLDGADLQAVLSRNSWWTIRRGPNDSAALRALLADFARLVRRLMAAARFYERSLAVHVWLDALKRHSPHSVEWGIDRLCFACEEYCSVLVTRSVDEVPESGKSLLRRTPSTRESIPSEENPKPQGTQPGPKVDIETANQVAEIVAKDRAGQRLGDKLIDICDALDNKNIKCPKKWRTRKPPIVDWSDAAATEPELAKKAILHHLKNAKN